MKSAPFLFYIVVVVLTFIPVIILGIIAEVAEKIRKSNLPRNKAQEDEYSAFAIQ